MRWDKEIRYFSIGLICGGLATIFSNSVSAGFVLIAYGLAGIVKDKQHTGKYFPSKSEVSN